MGKYNRIFDDVREQETQETEVATPETSSNSENFDAKYKGPWRASRNVNFRKGASKSAAIIEVVKTGGSMKCDGYFETDSDGNKWLKVIRKTAHGETATGYIMLEYLVRR